MRPAVVALLLLILPAQAAPPFRTGILPILTKAGCNSGGCHGAATGQGGFKLSLLGYDPEEDYLRITRERAGRRVDLDHPADSLVLRKPARQLDHEGGRRLPLDSDDYRILLDWIAAGSPRGDTDLAVASIELDPPDSLLTEATSLLPLRVTATLTDGSRQDVTRLALYTSNDDAIADVSRNGVVTPRGRGLTSIMVRYSGQVAAARVAIPYSSHPPAATIPIHNLIDRHVQSELTRLGLDASPLCSDAVFLRRASLDLTGRLPSPEEVREFTREPGTPERRARLVDTFLDREAFIDFWTLHVADLLLISGKGGKVAAIQEYHRWLRDRIAQREPLDRLVHALLTAQGNITQVGAANFFTLDADPRDLSEHVGRMFLGTRIACARCHTHPSDRWTQEDYHQFAAYFARVGRDADVIELRHRGEVDHPKSGLPVHPHPLGAPRTPPPTPAAAESDRRTELADWLTAPENPLFARSLVNRVWKHLLGRGLVEPVDDLRPTNPPSHPALLDALTRDFVDHRFDLQHLIRTITASATYQLSSIPSPSNRSDDRLFSHAYLKELPAQVFLDAMVQATGVPHRFEGQPDEIRAVQLIGTQTPSRALDVLGRCARERPCDAPGQSGGGLARALHLIHGGTIQDLLTGGVIDRLLEANASDDKVVTELYLRTLSRPPEPREIREWTGELSNATPRRETVQDLLWALLNSREFGFNH